MAAMQALRPTLVPDTPWCAKAAAWCGLALFGFVALGLLLRLVEMAHMWFCRWQMLHSFESGAVPGWATRGAGADAAVETVTVSVLAQSVSLVVGAACLAVGHVLSLFTRLREPLGTPPMRKRRGTIVFAMALGAASLLFAILGVCVMFRDGLCDKRLWPAGLVALQFLGLARVAGINLFSELGLGVLPFCLLRMADRVVPTPATPEDVAKVRRMETWTSVAFSAGVALTALDALRTLLNISGLLRLFAPMGLFHTTGLLAASLFPSVVMLCMLAAVRAMLRCLISGQALPDEPGRWSMPIAIGVAGCGLGAVVMMPLIRAGDGEMAEILSSHTIIVVWFQFLLGSAQFILVAALLRLLPIRAIRFPALAPAPASALLSGIIAKAGAGLRRRPPYLRGVRGGRGEIRFVICGQLTFVDNSKRPFPPE